MILPGGFKGFYSAPGKSESHSFRPIIKKAGRLNHQTIVQNVLLYKVVPYYKRGEITPLLVGVFSGHL